MKFKRFNIAEIRAERFYKLPQFLFEGELKKTVSTEAKVLYALLRNRFELSAKNNWVNDKGEVYLIFSRDEMCDMLNCRQEKVRKLIKQLITSGLIEEERVGQNMPNQIYLTYPDEIINCNNKTLYDEEDTLGRDSVESITAPTAKPAQKNASETASQAECRNSTVQKVKVRKINFSKNSEKSANKNSGVSKIDSPECRKSTPSKTNNNKTDCLYPSVHSDIKEEIDIYTHAHEGKKEKNTTQNYSDELNKTKEQIEYDILKQQYPSFLPNIVDSITEIITDIRTSPNAYIEIGKKRRPTEVFNFKLKKLTGLEIESIIQRYNSTLTPIHNPRAYLTSMLWNAGLEAPLIV